ncbi:MAG: C10 family peptidase [Paludibacteraceae bacterium]|nr:C10 family peptidase [Paludibacteraceae bacterium]
MKRTFPLIAILLIFVQTAFAALRSMEDAMSEAKSVLGSGVSVKLASVGKHPDGVLSYYVFSGTPSGFAIISAESSSSPVLAYDLQAEVNQSLPTQLSALLDVYSKNQSLQNENSGALRASKLVGHSVKPLLGNINWDQIDPYNYACPEYNGEKCVTGCVSLAMAQVMAYYQYPKTLQNDVDGFETETYHIDIEGIKKGTKIDWQNILHSYGGSYSSAQRKAVSDLIYMVGVAMKTDYAINMSGAVGCQAEAFADYFGYDPDYLQFLYRKAYTLPQWNKLLCDELEAGRPLIIDASSEGGRHSFVCDGIDENGLFHINWGWGGDCNGYYDITILNPYTTSAAGASTSKDGYYLDMMATIGIVPDNGVKDELNVSQYSVYASYVLPLSDTETFLTYFAVRKVSNATVEVGCAYKNAQGELVVFYEFEDDEDPGRPDRVTSFGTYDPYDFSTFAPGDYKLYMVEREKGGDWYLSDASENGVVKFSVSESGEVTFDIDEYRLSAEMDVISYDGKKANLNIMFKNSGTIEYAGNFTVKIWFGEKDDEYPDYQLTEGMTVESSDTTGFSFTLRAKSGPLYYEIYDKSKELIAQNTIIVDPVDIPLEPLEFEVTSSEFSGAWDDIEFELYIVNNKETIEDGLYFLVVNETDEMPEYAVAEIELDLKPGQDTLLLYSLLAEADTVYYWITDMPKWCMGNGEDAYYKKGVFIAKPSNEVVDFQKENDLLVWTSGRVLNIQSKKAKDVIVTSLSGEILYNRRFSVNDEVAINLKPGVYMVNDVKVLIK